MSGASHQPYMLMMTSHVLPPLLPVCLSIEEAMLALSHFISWVQIPLQEQHICSGCWLISCADELMRVSALLSSRPPKISSVSDSDKVRS